MNKTNFANCVYFRMKMVFFSLSTPCLASQQSSGTTYISNWFGPSLNPAQAPCRFSESKHWWSLPLGQFLKFPLESS